MANALLKSVSLTLQGMIHEFGHYQVRSHMFLRAFYKRPYVIYREVGWMGFQYQPCSEIPGRRPGYALTTRQISWFPRSYTWQVINLDTWCRATQEETLHLWTYWGLWGAHVRVLLWSHFFLFTTSWCLVFSDKVFLCCMGWRDSYKRSGKYSSVNTACVLDLPWSTSTIGVYVEAEIVPPPVLLTQETPVSTYGT